MSSERDITHLVERVEAFEARCGVTLGGLFATLEGPDHDGDYTVTVNGEVRPAGGDEVENDLQLSLAIYDGAGRVVGKADTYLSAASFFGFETVSLTTYVKGVRPAKLRFFPKAS